MLVFLLLTVSVVTYPRVWTCAYTSARARGYGEQCKCCQDVCVFVLIAQRVCVLWRDACGFTCAGQTDHVTLAVPLQTTVEEDDDLVSVENILSFDVFPSETVLKRFFSLSVCVSPVDVLKV